MTATQDKDCSITFRTTTSTKAALTSLGNTSERSISYWANRAIETFVWQTNGIKTAIKDIDEGRTVDWQDVKIWLHSWDKKDELPMPKAS